MIPSEAKNSAAIIGIPFLAQLANLIQYIELMAYDVLCLCEDMLTTRSRWKKKLYARLIAITIFESMNDLAFLLGKPFKEKLINIRLPNFDTNRRTVHKEIVEFNKAHNDRLKKIRNTVIGHRDHNAEMQIDIIKSLRPGDIYRVSADFFSVQSKFHTLLYLPLMKEVNARLMLLSKKTTGSPDNQQDSGSSNDLH